MKEYADIIAFLVVAPLLVFSGVLVIQAFREKHNKVGPALKGSINKFS